MERTGINPAQAIVVVNVMDVNEPPVFVSSHYSTSITEGTTIGSQLFAGILAIDNDEVMSTLLRLLVNILCFLCNYRVPMQPFPIPSCLFWGTKP